MVGHPVLVAVVALAVIGALIVLMACWEKWDFLQREKDKQEIKEYLDYVKKIRK